MAQLPELEYSQPLAILFRDNTKEDHDIISHSPAANIMLKGELPKAEYIRLLMMYWHVYSTLEHALEQHASHPVLELTSNPSLLARAPALSSDISYLLQVPEDEWQSHPIHVELMANMPPALSAYTGRIQELASTNPAQLLPHAYIRYLGDLSGGQSIRYILAKAYQLEVDSRDGTGPGVSFYAFKSLHSNELANQGEIRRIGQWFRDGTNKAGEIVGYEGKEALVDEARKVFRYNAALFASLRLPANVAVGAHPGSLPVPSKPSTAQMSQSKSGFYNAEKTSSSANSGLASHVLAALAAIYLAHAAWSGTFPEFLGFGRWILYFLTTSD